LALALPLSIIYASQRFGFQASDSMAVIGLALTFAFGFVGNRIANLFATVRIGVVIPSKAAFFKDIRRGLRDELTDLDANIEDEYDSIFRSTEDVMDFEPCLRRTIRRRPDFLVLCCPLPGFAARMGVSAAVTDITSRGGAVFFIENGPTDEILSITKNVYVLAADHSEGVAVLARFIKNEFMRSSLILLNGPRKSAPAEIRAAQFRSELPDIKIESDDMSGWTASAAKASACRTLSEVKDSVVFVCGNDSMALGAVEAIREAGRSNAVAIGYDGIRQALASIATVNSPFVATLRTPPSAYGYQIGSLIKAQCSARSHIRSTQGERILITVDESHLVTKWNVDNILDEIW